MQATFPALMVICLSAGADAELETGLEFLLGGEYSDAIESFEKAAKSEDETVAQRAVRGWADALVATGKYEEAIALLQKQPGYQTSGMLTARAGRVFLRMGKLEEARVELTKARALDRRSPETLYALGETLRRSGKTDEAEQVFNFAIRAYSELSAEEAESLPAEAFVYWGLALIRLNRYSEANDIMFSQAEEVDEDDPLLLLERGRAFLEKYNFPDSRDDYREAIDTNPDYADALAALAENYLTDFMVGTKRFDQAEKYITRALEVNPRHSKAHEMHGRIWYYDGDLVRAEKDFNRAVESDPSSLGARAYLAATYWVMGNREAYEKVETETLAINPKAAEFYHTIAVAIEPKFRYPEIVRMCDRALAIDPEYWPAYHTLGINCLRTGEAARGREYIEKSWAQDKFNVWVYNTRLLLKHMDRNFVTFKNDRFEYHLPRADAPFIRPYLEPLLDRAWTSMSKRYKVEIEKPIRIESFSQHKWFSARTVGLGGFAASGACFGKLVTLTTPKALPQNWGAVAWHEFAHVVTIQLTNYRVPRWLTEGISVYEEGYDHPRWARNFQREIADAWGSGRVLPMGELDLGFSKPKYPMQILNSYYQGCLIVQYITQKWGFDAVLAILDGYKSFKGTRRVFRDVLELELEEFDRGFGEYVAAWVAKNGYAPRIAESMIPRLELKRDQDEKNVALLNDLGWAYYCAQNETDTRLTVGAALELAPDSGDAHAILGMLHYQTEKPKQARKELEKALELGSRFGFRVNAILGDLNAKDDPKAAIEYYEEAKRISPIAGAGSPAKGNTYYKLAKLYEEEGNQEKAHEQLESLADFAVEDPACRMQLVQAALLAKDSKKAAKYLEELVWINPFDEKLHRYLADAADEIGDHDTVIRETKILLLQGETNTLKAHLRLAKAYLANEDLEQAAEHAGKVLEIDPENDEAKSVREEATKGR